MQAPAPSGEHKLELSDLSEMNFAFASSRVLTAAVQLGLFSQIEQGRRTAAEIADGADASQRGVRMLLDALVALRLLFKKDGEYALSPVAARYLVRERPDYMGFTLESDYLWRSWTHLTEAVRTGRPFSSVAERERGEEFFPVLVRSLHITNREPARRLALALDLTENQALEVLDVACGSGVWGIAVAQRNPQARITALDFPKVLDLTREYAALHDVSERFEYLPGDLRTTDLGEGRFDLALLGNICHSAGERDSRELFRRVRRALRPGGRVVIIDTLPNDERSGPVFPLVFALNMLLNTAEGDVFTFAQYQEWLAAAGFARAETLPIGTHSPAIVAVNA